MPDIPADTLPRLQTWWSSLEGGTQAIFEAIYMEAPGVVSRALSGGEWEADAPEPGLAAQLGVDDPGSTVDSIPSLDIVAGPDCTPFHANVGQAVTITWTEQNMSRADLPPYVSDVYVYDAGQNPVGSARLEGDGLAAGASKEQTWTFTGAVTEGFHSVTIYLNAEGADRGSGVPGPQGYRGGAGATFEVGGGEGFERAQDDTAWTHALMALQGVSNGMPSEVLTYLNDGVNWLAACSGLTEEERSDVGVIGSRLSSWDAEGMPRRLENLQDVLADISGVALQSGGASDDARARSRLIETLKQLQTVP